MKKRILAFILLLCLPFIVSSTGSDWWHHPIAGSTPFDNSTNGYTADNVQDAIEETKATAGSSRYAVIFSYNGNVSNKWLELFQSVPSDASPFVIAENSQMVSLSVSAKVNCTATFTVYKNGGSIDTLTLTAAQTNYKIMSPLVSLAGGDTVSTKITSGSCSDPVFVTNVKVN